MDVDKIQRSVADFERMKPELQAMIADWKRAVEHRRHQEHQQPDPAPDPVPPAGDQAGAGAQGGDPNA